MMRARCRFGLRRLLHASAFVATAASGGVWALSSPELLHQGIPHDALYDVCFDARGGLAVGAAGVMLESDPAGITWKQEADALTPLALLGVVCAPDRRIAVGQEGTILLDDGGGWRPVPSGSRQRLLAVAANERGLAVAVGGFGTVLLSEDSGESWRSVSFDWHAIVEDFAEPHIYDVSLSADGTITIVGEFELVMQSVDGGRNWERRNRGDASLFGLHLAEDGSGFAVGQQGRILRTADGGRTWEGEDGPVSTLLLGVLPAGEGRLLISGMRTMLLSEDAGASWSEISGADIATGWYAGLAVTGAGASARVISVGNVGRVLGLSVRDATSEDKQNR